MTNQVNKRESQLSGHWNLSGVVLRIESPATLRQLETGLEKLLCADRSEIDGVDRHGLQLLNVWMQCVALRGLKPELINLPEGMQRAIKRMGLEKCFEEK